MADDNDPVVASYDVVFSQPVAQGPIQQKLFVLQYPAHRSVSRPYNSARGQKPTSFRLRPKTGVVEMEVPIQTAQHYSTDAGERYGKALLDSRTTQSGGSYGLGGGFQQAPQHLNTLRDMPIEDPETTQLASQTLGGKVMEPTERDPIYFVGTLRNDRIHLSPVDGLVQMRPQLHHIDAEDENTQKRMQMSAAVAAGKKPGDKTESKAIEVKISAAKEDGRDRSLNENSKILRQIHVEPWRTHEWIDQDDELSKFMGQQMSSDASSNADIQTTTTPSHLRSALSNGDWLDKMSAPREDGKKGLLAKLRGRERERARRKKAEEEKKRKTKDDNAPAAPAVRSLFEQSSDSDLTSPEASDLEPETTEKNLTRSTAATGQGINNEIHIKEEPGTQATASADTAAPKRRGRPKKSQVSTTVDLS